MVHEVNVNENIGWGWLQRAFLYLIGDGLQKPPGQETLNRRAYMYNAIRVNEAKVRTIAGGMPLSLPAGGIIKQAWLINIQ